MCASWPAPGTGCATRCQTDLYAAKHAATTEGKSKFGSCCSLLGYDWNLNLRATDHPEFDAWRWNDYWVPLEVVVEFKRGVYEMALTELARFLPRGEQPRNRYLRGGMRNREGEREGERRELRGPDAGLEPTRSALRTPWAPGNLPMALPPGPALILSRPPAPSKISDARNGPAGPFLRLNQNKERSFF